MKKPKELLSAFEKSVYEATAKIPCGRVTTYAEIARKIKKPGSARAVGNALNKNPFAPKVPCHRVVKTDGTVGGFASGSEKKKVILKKEGIQFNNEKILHFNEKFIKL